MPMSQATRPTSNSIFDLVLNSSPFLIENIQTVAGISNHLVEIFDAKLKPHIPKKLIKKVCQFYKAHRVSLKMKAKAVLEEVITSDPTKNDLYTKWYTIKNIVIIIP